MRLARHNIINISILLEHLHLKMEMEDQSELEEEEELVNEENTNNKGNTSSRKQNTSFFQDISLSSIYSYIQLFGELLHNIITNFNYCKELILFYIEYIKQNFDFSTSQFFVLFTIIILILIFIGIIYMYKNRMRGKQKTTITTIELGSNSIIPSNTS